MHRVSCSVLAGGFIRHFILLTAFLGLTSTYSSLASEVNLITNSDGTGYDDLFYKNDANQIAIASSTKSYGDAANLPAWSTESTLRYQYQVLVATGDIKYLTGSMYMINVLYGIDSAGNLVSGGIRDDLYSPSRIDTIRNRTVKGWGTNDYGGWYVSMVQSAVIASASAKFANYVLVDKKNDANFATYSNWAKQVITQSKNLLVEFSHEISTTLSGSYYKKWYNFPVNAGSLICPAGSSDSCTNEKNSAGKVVPFNHSLAMGQLILEIFKTTPTTSLAQVLVGLHNHFILDSGLTLTSSGYYTWNYWQTVPAGASIRKEDVSHGNIDLAFLMGFQDQKTTILKYANLNDPAANLWIAAKSLTDAEKSKFVNSVQVARVNTDDQHPVYNLHSYVGDPLSSLTTSSDNYFNENARSLQEWCIYSKYYSSVNNINLLKEACNAMSVYVFIKISDSSKTYREKGILGYTIRMLWGN